MNVHVGPIFNWILVNDDHISFPEATGPNLYWVIKHFMWIGIHNDRTSGYVILIWEYDWGTCSYDVHVDFIVCRFRCTCTSFVQESAELSSLKYFLYFSPLLYNCKHFFLLISATFYKLSPLWYIFGNFSQQFFTFRQFVPTFHHFYPHFTIFPSFVHFLSFMTTDSYHFLTIHLARSFSPRF